MRSPAVSIISPGWRAHRCASPPSPTPPLSPLSRLDSGDATPPFPPSCSIVVGTQRDNYQQQQQQFKKKKNLFYCHFWGGNTQKKQAKQNHSSQKKKIVSCKSYLLLSHIHHFPCTYSDKVKSSFSEAVGGCIDISKACRLRSNRCLSRCTLKSITMLTRHALLTGIEL